MSGDMEAKRDRVYAFIEDTAVPLKEEEPVEVVQARLRRARKTVAARRRAKRAGLAGTLLAVVTAIAFAGPAQADTTGKVTRIVDGDTVVVTDAAGIRSTVRILGIDTPETRKPRSPVQCWGPEASLFARDTLLGETVSVVNDPTQARVDRWGRELGEIAKPDGWNYSVEAARAGMARSYVYQGHPSQVAGAVAEAERQAQAAHRGLWGPPCNGHR